MLITLSGLSRGKFRADIVRHRAQSNMTDADYATRVLGVSVNTYKKCVELGKSLALKRHTFNNIVANANLESLSYGAAHVAPARQTGGFRAIAMHARASRSTGDLSRNRNEFCHAVAPMCKRAISRLSPGHDFAWSSGDAKRRRVGDGSRQQRFDIRQSVCIGQKSLRQKSK